MNATRERIKRYWKAKLAGEDTTPFLGPRIQISVADSKIKGRPQPEPLILRDLQWKSTMRY